MSKIGFIKKEYSARDKVNNCVPFDFLHSYVTGMTGSGKTASIIRPTIEDRIKRGNSILFFAYKGHEHKYIKKMAKEANRLKDVVEIGKPFGEYVNILDFLNNKLLEKMIKGEGTKNLKDYWYESSASWLINVVNMLRSINKLDKIIKKLDTKYQSVDNISFFCDKYKDVSFDTAGNIFRNVASFSKFQKELKECQKELVKLHQDFPEIYCDSFFDSDDSNGYTKTNIDQVLQEFIVAKDDFNDNADMVQGMTVEEEKDGAGGNNGVLQMIYNLVSPYMGKDFLNKSNKDILQLIEDKKIIIVDTESLNDNIISVFLESLLIKVSLRVKNSNKTPLSIIVDEANSVYPSDAKMYNDILREAKAELILSFQNEDQMIDKFGLNKWQSFERNFQHKYNIDRSHNLYYNDIQINDFSYYEANIEELNEAEAKYNSLQHNKKRLKELFFATRLPSNFIIEYSIDMFEKDKKIKIVPLQTNENSFFITQLTVSQQQELKFLSDKIKYNLPDYKKELKKKRADERRKERMKKKMLEQMQKDFDELGLIW